MPTDTQTFVFGDFELDEARFELRRSGRAVDLRATPFRLLQHLVRERGRVVPKDELLESVWPDVTVSDTALSSALKAVRQALGDDGKQQRWIQTLRKRGIRFVAGAASAAVPTVPPRTPPAQRSEASLATILAVRSAAHRRRPVGRVRLGG